MCRGDLCSETIRFNQKSFFPNPSTEISRNKGILLSQNVSFSLLARAKQNHHTIQRILEYDRSTDANQFIFVKCNIVMQEQ